MVWTGGGLNRISYGISKQHKTEIITSGGVTNTGETGIVWNGGG